jgi:hypothetical protein
MTMPCDIIARELGALFTCTPHDARFVRIRTPYLYPDGDVIDVFFSEAGGQLQLTDLGESLRWLRGQTPGARRSPKQRQLLDDVCLNHGVELFKGMLTARLSGPSELPAALMRLCQAALRVGDLWFTFRTRATQAVTDDIADFFTDRNIPFERSEKLAGRSGRGWTVDFHTRTKTRSSLVWVLATGSRAASKGVAEHVAAGWYDLNHFVAGPSALRFVSLFDDTVDVWTPEDLRLLEPLSTVSRWSRPDELEQVLTDAA